MESIADMLSEEIKEVTYPAPNGVSIVFLSDVERLLRLAYDLGVKNTKDN